MKAKDTTLSRLERLLTWAGLALVVVGCLANLYSIYVNRGFIRDPIDCIYYFRYIILLGGGFAAGYLLTKKSIPRAQLFTGATYAILTMALFWLFDFARVGLQSVADTPPYPLGKAVFMGMPLFLVVITSIIAYFSQYRPGHSGVSTLAKASLITSFILYQAGILVAGVYYYVADLASHDSPSIWTTLGGYLLTPPVIAIVAYLVLRAVPIRFERLFCAVFIGMFYSTLTLTLWEFRTDASSEMTDIFSGVVTAIALFFTGILIWQTRQSRSPQKRARQP